MLQGGCCCRAEAQLSAALRLAPSSRRSQLHLGAAGAALLGSRSPDLAPDGRARWRRDFTVPSEKTSPGGKISLRQGDPCHGATVLLERRSEGGIPDVAVPAPWGCGCCSWKWPRFGSVTQQKAVTSPP